MPRNGLQSLRRKRLAHFTKLTRGSSLFMEKSLPIEKTKAEKDPW